MREVTVSKIISADREAIFDLVSDLASRPAYADHYMRDYRLARVYPIGEGAAARFQVKKPFAKEYAELQVTEVDRPRRIVEQIALGRRGRNRFLAVYDFGNEAPGVTRVELTTYGEAATFVGPPEADRRRRLDQAADRQAAGAAAHDLRGARQGAAQARHDRGL